MGSLTLSWLRIALIAVASMFASGAFAQTPQDRIDEFISNQLLYSVVFIRTEVAGTSRVGSGLIFGRSGETLWIATAAHVVSSTSSAQKIETLPASAIQVKMKDDSRVWPVSSPPILTVTHDLAFFGIRVPLAVGGADMWRNNVQVTTAPPGTSVRIAAIPGEIAYGKPGATVAKSAVLSFDSLNGLEGQSGAPVATSKGFVGIYTKSAGDRVIPIGEIEMSASKAGRPWHLTEAPIEPKSAEVCLKVRSDYPVRLTIRGDTGAISPDGKDCYSMRSGPAVIFAPPDAGLVCEPSSINLLPGKNQDLMVACGVNPAGTWMSTEYGVLVVSPVSTGTWKAVGLQGPALGGISGTLTGTPPQLFFQGTGALKQMTNGQFVLSPREMRGELVIGGSPYQLKLSR